MAEADWADLALPVVTLKYAMRELERGVEEEGGDNRGKAVREYLEAGGIDSPAPWCAGFVNWAAERAAMLKGTTSPLEEVEYQAYVQSYAEWAAHEGRVVQPSQVGLGDLFLLYDATADDPVYGGTGRYVHMGFVREPPFGGWQIQTIEGNSNRDGSARGYKVVSLTRPVRNRVMFIRWSED